MLGLGNSIVNLDFVSGATAALLLDAFDGASAAYSFRHLNSSYSGNAINVRRVNDHAEAEIGFSGGVLDTTALAAHCGSNDGFVIDWLDQSGNGYDLTQDNRDYQPKIYDGSSASVMADASGKPALEFDGVDDGFVINSSPIASYDIGNMSSFIVGKFNNTANTTVMLALSSASANRRWYAPYVTAGTFYFGYSDSSSAASATANTNQNLFTMIAGSTLGAMGAWVNATSAGTATLSSGFNEYTNGIGIFNGSQFFLNGNVQEVFYYSSDKSDKRTGIQSNVNSFYSIY